MKYVGFITLHSDTLWGLHSRPSTQSKLLVFLLQVNGCCTEFSKLWRLGPTNRILDNSDSKPSKFEHPNLSNDDDKIRLISYIF